MIPSHFWVRWGERYSLEDYLGPNYNGPDPYFAPYCSPQEMKGILDLNSVHTIIAGPVKIVERVLVDSTIHYLVEYV